MGHDHLPPLARERLLGERVQQRRQPLLAPVRRDDDAMALLMLSDAGPGIAPDLHSRLFTPFTTGGMPGGSGLGLTICREIVRALHGRIALDNRCPEERIEGLDVSVRLPRRPD